MNLKIYEPNYIWKDLGGLESCRLEMRQERKIWEDGHA